MVDGDSLLRSKWSMALFPDLPQWSRPDLQQLSRWLQVHTRAFLLRSVQCRHTPACHTHVRAARQVEVERYNKLFARRDPSMAEADFVAVAAQHADKLYSRAFAELSRLQVSMPASHRSPPSMFCRNQHHTVHAQAGTMSQEVGRLWADVWAAHSAALAGALLRLREQATSGLARWAGLRIQTCVQGAIA